MEHPRWQSTSMASVDELSEQLAGGARLSRREVLDSSVDLSTEARSFTGYKDALRKQYPPLEPFEHTYLRMESGKTEAQPASAHEAEASQRNSGTHYVYVEQCGWRNGQPVVFLHGGPGGGATTDDRRWFDPAHYRIVLLDQRGSGRSRPHADLGHNTTWDLVGDLERIRTHLGIEKWHVFGGSWGSTLSLAYAQAHPDRVSALILRGIFTLRKSELNFFYGSDGGASHLFPDQFERYVEFIPPEERGDMIRAYYARLTGRDANVQREAADRWSTWENATSKLYVDREAIARGDDVEVCGKTPWRGLTGSGRSPSLASSLTTSRTAAGSPTARC